MLEDQEGAIGRENAWRNDEQRLLPLVNGMPVPREKVDPQQDPGAKSVLVDNRTRVSISQCLRVSKHRNRHYCTTIGLIFGEHI